MTRGRHIKFKGNENEYVGLALGKTTLFLAKDIAVQIETPKKAKTITKDEFCQRIRDTYWDLFINATARNDKTSALDIARWNILELRHDGICQATTINEELHAMTEQIGTLHATGLYVVAGNYGIMTPQQPAYGFEKITTLDLTRIIGKPQLQKMQFIKNGRIEEMMIDRRWVPTEENVRILLEHTYPDGLGEITPEHNGKRLITYYVRTAPPEAIKYIKEMTDTPELDQSLTRFKTKLEIQAQEIMSKEIQI